MPPLSFLTFLITEVATRKDRNSWYVWLQKRLFTMFGFQERRDLRSAQRVGGWAGWPAANGGRRGSGSALVARKRDLISKRDVLAIEKAAVGCSLHDHSSLRGCHAARKHGTQS